MTDDEVQRIVDDNVGVPFEDRTRLVWEESYNVVVLGRIPDPAYPWVVAYRNDFGDWNVDTAPARLLSLPTPPPPPSVDAWWDDLTDAERAMHLNRCDGDLYDRLRARTPEPAPSPDPDGWRKGDDTEGLEVGDRIEGKGTWVDGSATVVDFNPLTVNPDGEVACRRPIRRNDRWRPLPDPDVSPDPHEGLEAVWLAPEDVDVCTDPSAYWPVAAMVAAARATVAAREEES